MVDLFWKRVWQFLKKLSIELSCDPAILHLGIYPSELKMSVQEKICTWMFIAVLFIIAKKWKQTKRPSVGE